MNKAHIRIEDRFQDVKMPIGIVLQVHDALISEVPENRREEADNIMQEEMETPVRIFDADYVFPTAVKFGTNWQEASNE
jgi:DNA polymerase I-like protein with 3'-5' exonuclease and polymerase domains